MDINQLEEETRNWQWNTKKIYRSSQILANDNTESVRTRNFAREVGSYARDSMNAAYLSARLNFEQYYTPSNEYQVEPPVYRTTSHTGGDIHNQESSSEFSDNEFDVNTALSLQTPTTPYYHVFYYGGASTSVPNYLSLHNKVVILKLLMFQLWVLTFLAALKILNFHKTYNNVNFKTHPSIMGH